MVSLHGLLDIGELMKVKSNGCQRYIKATITLNFPEGHVSCDMCPLMHGYERKYCARTGDYLYDSRGIGMNCPLQFIEEEQ